MRLLTVTLIAVCSALSAAGCAKPCTAGETRACTGPGACRGGQQCLPDGTGYSQCDCGGSGGGSAGGSAGGFAGGSAGGAAGGEAGGEAGGSAGGSAGGGADAGPPDAGPPDAGEARWFGEVSYLELTAVNRFTGEIGQLTTAGSVIAIAFAERVALPACVGDGVAPCQVGTTADPCLTVLSRLDAGSPPTAYVGDITLTTAPDPSEAPLYDPPSLPVGTCVVRDEQYECPSAEGDGGRLVVDGGTSPGVARFRDFRVGSGSFTGVQGMRLKALVGTNRVSLLIFQVNADQTLNVSFPSGVNSNVIDWRVSPGGLQYLSGAPQPLHQSDAVHISYDGGAGFGPQADRVVPVGDRFLLDFPTQAVVAKLDDRSDISGQPGDFELGCSLCGGSGAASGTHVRFDVTTATEHVVTTCWAPGADRVRVPTQHWNLIRFRAPSISSIRMTLSRPRVVDDLTVPTHPVRFSIGHAASAWYGGDELVPLTD